jgi:CRISPR-associated protein Csd1
MLLQRLRDYSERLVLPPTLYSELAVNYLIELDGEGRFLGLVATADNSNPRTRRGQLRRVPEVVKTSGIRPLLLCDKVDYVIGYVAEGARPDRVAEAHRAFVELTRRCAVATEEPAVSAVLRFLENDPLDQVSLPADFRPGDRMTFRVDGTCPIDLPSVQAFWAAENDPDQAGAPTMTCVICGQPRLVLRRLQAKLKGVPGGQTSGTSIISANAEAFESYGLEASLIAPTCADCGERFTKAANELLGSRESRTALAGAAFIYWTREDVGFDMMGPLTAPPEDFRALLESLRRGGSGAEARVDETRLYATVLSGSGGRAVVRDWIDTTVGEVKDRLALWFRRQAIVDGYGEEPRPLGIAALAGATVRQLSDVPRPTTRALLHGALTSTPLPLDLLYQAVRRNRAEQDVTRPRTALIKLVLSSQPENSHMEDSMINLDQENTDPAYRCGRLLAVLEQAQRLAIPGVNATIVDRYFGTASSAPGAVFPRLVRGAQPHLAKLERDNRPAAIALQRRLEEILSGLEVRKVGALYTGFPPTLTLQSQGLFSLGYYHQRAFDRAQAVEAAARRRAGGAPGPDVDDDDGDPVATDPNS